MSFLTADEIRAITRGQWVQRVPDTEADQLVGVGIDTRGDLSRSVYVALVGAQHDGHAFLESAQTAGAALAIVEQDVEAPEALGVLRVDDTRRALADLARAWRRTLKTTKVIAVTGSAGKTTTKNLIHQVLSTKVAGTCAVRSFNNDVGVPLTLLRARPQDRYVVVEIGSNHLGEISALSGLAEPDIAVITNVGRAHLEGFGSMEAVIGEKTSILRHLRPGGLAVIVDMPSLDAAATAASKSGAVLRFGDNDRSDAPDPALHTDLRLTEHRRREDGGWAFQVNGRLWFDLALPGTHNAINALAAVAIGRRFGLDDATISAALAAMEPAPGRFVRRVAGGASGITIFDDTYNANPDSTAAALETFVDAAADARRRIIVLGDMLELGDAGPALHREVGRRIVALDQRRSIDHAVLIGPLAARMADELGRAWDPDRYTTLERLDDAAIDAIAARLEPGDAVLVKASRGIGLDRLTRILEEQRPVCEGSSTIEVHLSDAPPGRRARAATPRRET